MIERLQRALEHVGELPPDEQEEIAELIEEWIEPAEMAPPANGHQPNASEADLPKSVRDALSVIGAWSDMQDDDEFAALDRIRHESVPTPPMDEQLWWLKDE